MRSNLSTAIFLSVKTSILAPLMASIWSRNSACLAASGQTTTFWVIFLLAASSVGPMFMNVKSRRNSCASS